jgi:hypothetical protein
VKKHAQIEDGEWGKPAKNPSFSCAPRWGEEGLNRWGRKGTSVEAALGCSLRLQFAGGLEGREGGVTVVGPARTTVEWSGVEWRGVARVAYRVFSRHTGQKKIDRG